MSQELRDLMVRAAESAPTVRVDEGLWRDARRARRRQLLVAPLAAAVIVLGVLGLAWQGSSLVSGGREIGPVTGETRPAMPSHVYAVPERLNTTRPDGSWSHPRDDTLAVGVTAAAFTGSGFAPVAVSAVDGTYHLLDLPGHDRMTGFRFEDGVLGLSPDGQRLAYTWNRAVPGSGGDRYVPSGVRIVDLLTGQVESHQVHRAYGVFAHGFSWSPDGRYLAYNIQIANTSPTGSSGTRNFFVERLDTRTGERSRATGVPMRDVAPVVTDSGTVVTGSDTTLWTWRPDRGVRVVDLARSGRWRGSVVSIGALPGTDRVVVSAGREYSRLYTGSPERPATFRRISQGAYRLTLAGPVSGGRQAVLEQTQTGTTLWTIRTPGPRLNDRSTALVRFDDAGAQYSFATALLRRPTRDFPEPDWPLSVEQKVMRGGAAVVGIAALGLGVWLRRRRRRPGPVG